MSGSAWTRAQRPNEARRILSRSLRARRGGKTATEAVSRRFFIEQLSAMLAVSRLESSMHWGYAWDEHDGRRHHRTAKRSRGRLVAGPRSARRRD